MRQPQFTNIDISAYDTKSKVTIVVLVFYISNIIFFSRIKIKIADRCNQTVNSTRYETEKQVSQRSSSVSFGFKFCVINNNASNPPQEKGQKKTNKIFVFHNVVSPLLK